MSGMSFTARTAAVRASMRGCASGVRCVVPQSGLQQLPDRDGRTYLMPGRTILGMTASLSIPYMVLCQNRRFLTRSAGRVRAKLLFWNRPIAVVRKLSSNGLMAELVFEIWSNTDDGSFEMGAVSGQADQLRKSIGPNSNRVYSFFAASDFEAQQLNYDYHGWGKWQAPPGLLEHFFTESEAEEQRVYLKVRSGG